MTLTRLASIALAVTVLAACGDAEVEETANGDTAMVPPAITDTPTTPVAPDTQATVAKPGDTNAPTPAVPMDRPVVSQSEQARIDAWLAAYADSLNDYGDPKGTMYAGGTPLFNETEGKPISKYEYIVARHPEKPWEQPLPTSRPKPKTDEKKESSDGSDE